MKFSFTEDQRLLARAVREALAKSCPPETVRAAKTDPAVRRGDAWRALAELGLLGAHVPEEHGGLGLTPLDTVLAYEEIGRAAVPGPIVETAVAAPLLAGPEWLERIATGAAAVSVSTDHSPYLLDADLADLLVVQRGDGVIRAAPGTVRLTGQPSADPTRRLFSVDGSFGSNAGSDARHAGPERADPEQADPARAIDHAALATAAQLLGLGRHLLDAAVAYAGQRRQFGRQIGSFQAVKHQLADVAIALGFAAPAVHRAAYTLTQAATTSHSASAPSLPPGSTAHSAAVATASRDASAAKVAAAGAARRAVRTALQVHGGIGYTDELDLHLWFARVWSLRTTWGDDRWHRARLSAALLGEPAVPRVP
ncbi:acyl-CoA dehydrogenase family protein [Actinomadura scrupuli]|uniref:acyl-CoA dehydrogenase family protein n=1 Tax=Actinomadura scrupuli TaxID=559629 RepID=UPI003D96A2EA